MMQADHPLTTPMQTAEERVGDARRLIREAFAPFKAPGKDEQAVQ